MRRILGGLLMGAGAFALAYGLFNSLIFASATREIGCGHNPVFLRITAVALAGGLSAAASGARLSLGGRPLWTAWLGWTLAAAWLVAGGVVAASFVALPACGFPAR